MAKRILAGLVLALLATSTALAGGKGDVRSRVEASMLVTGTLVVEADGRVSGWELDKREALLDPVVELIGKAADSWVFEPVLVDGEAVRAKARMSLRVVAIPHGEDSFQLTIRSGHFGSAAESRDGNHWKEIGTDRVRAKRRDLPEYPFDAMASGVGGTVYLVLRINRAGRVQDAFVEQVNLRAAASEREMDQLRGTLARPALAAARRWTFDVPTTGEDADRKTWALRVPVEYLLYNERMPAYGEWHVYIPGPRHKAPWSKRELREDESPDAMIAGRLYQEGTELTLLTPLAPLASLGG